MPDGASGLNQSLVGEGSNSCADSDCQKKGTHQLVAKRVGRISWSSAEGVPDYYSLLAGTSSSSSKFTTPSLWFLLSCFPTSHFPLRTSHSALPAPYFLSLITYQQQVRVPAFSRVELRAQRAVAVIRRHPLRGQLKPDACRDAIGSRILDLRSCPGSYPGSYPGATRSSDPVVDYRCAGFRCSHAPQPIRHWQRQMYRCK